jgi:predicted metal-dependent phosphoesterase TrpH
MRKIDLHLHTNYSDGTDTPQQVVEAVKAAGIAAFTISDHDTVDGFSEAQAVAARLQVEFIPGIELSCDYEGIDVHVLGFLFDAQDDALRIHLATQYRLRRERVKRSVMLLAGQGVRIDADEVLELAGHGTVGRPHIARVMLKYGYVGSFREAFDVYLGSGKPAYVAGSDISTEEGIALIRNAGGIPVIAHPIFLGNDDLLAVFKQQGALGIEAYHSKHSPAQRQRYAALAHQLGMVCTGGSDYHGDGNQEGSAVGCADVDYACLEELRALQQR